MAIIYSYPTVIPTANDLVLGTDVDQVDKPTKNFTVQSIIDLVTVTGNDLQAVLNNGNTATQNIVLTGNISATQYTDGTMSIATGVGTGFTSITSTDFAGNLTGIIKAGSSIQSTVTGVTQNQGDNSTRLATTAYVDSKVDPSVLQYLGDSTGPFDLNLVSDDFKITGTANQIETTATAVAGNIGVINLKFPTAGIVLPNGSTATTQAAADNTTKVATTAFVKQENDAQDLDFTTGSGSGTVLLNSQTLTLAGTANQITTAGSGQAATFALTSSVTISGTYTGATFAGDLLGTVNTATTGTTQSAGDNSTKIATTAYVDNAAGAKTLDYAGDSTGPFTLNLSTDDLEFNGDSNISVSAAAVAANKGIVTIDLNNDVTISGTMQAGTLSDGTFSGTAGTYTGGVSITSTTFVGALTGNASSATQLASSGAIALTGDTTSTGGPYTYTSGGALNIATTIADTTVTGKVLTNLPTPTSAAIAASDTILAAMAKLQGQITGIPQGLVYKGTWNASTNTPTLASGTGTTGEFYIVSVAGTTNLDGITDWQVGDWAIFVEVGATDTWQKIDNTSAILGSGTTNKIAKWTGSNTLATGLISDDGTDVTIGNSGNLIVEGNTTLGNADSDTTTVKGPAHFEEQLRVDEGISLGNNTYGSAGQVLTSGGGSSSVNTWTTPTTGTVTSVTAGTGITIGGTAADPTVSIDVVGTDNAVEVLTAATPASGDFIWFSDINDSNTLRKCTLADIQNPVGGPFLPLAGGTMTGNTLHGDGVKSMYGAGNDLQIDHDGTNSAINNITGNFIIQQSVDDQDLVFKCDDGSGGVTEYFRLDGSSVFNIFSKQVYLPDNVKATFGDGSDLQIYHDATDSYISNTEGDLIIQNDHNDKDIFFKCDSGAGGLVSYFFLDGSDVNTRFAKDYKVSDSIKGLYGSDGDLEIFHDGSNSFISEVGTGDLTISTNGTSIFLKTNSTESSADFITNGAVKLYYDNSLTFETTTSGVSVTGDISLTGDINIGAGKKLIYNSNSFITPENNTSGAEVSTAGTFTVKTGGTPTLGLTVKADQVIQISDYGSGTNTGTPTFNLEVDSAGNIIETPSLNPGGKGGVYTGNKSFTGGAAAATLFRLTRGTTGALVFDVYLTSGTSQYSVKKYTVAHILNTVPTYNKIIDSGFTTNGDYTVAFVNDGQGVGGDTVKCTIAATTSQDIYYTVVVGHGATAVTRHTS